MQTTANEKTEKKQKQKEKGKKNKPSQNTIYSNVSQEPKKALPNLM